MCYTSKKTAGKKTVGKKTAGKNVMTNKAVWSADIPVSIALDSSESIKPYAVKFFNVPKLAAFAIDGNHPAVKDLKIKGRVVLLKTGYSSGLILNVESLESNKFLSKKVMFTEAHDVWAMKVAITYSLVAPPVVVETTPNPETAGSEAAPVESAPGV